MTGRGRLVLALAAACYLAAWALGSKPLYPVAVGLALAVLVAVVWVRLSAGRCGSSGRRAGGRNVEGEVVPRAARPRSSRRGSGRRALVVSERIGRLGERTTPGSTGCAAATCSTRSRAVATRSSARPRGSRTRSASPRPTCRCRRAARCSCGRALVVLERLFSDVGSGRPGGAPAGVRRPTGYDVHGVRE